MPAGEITFDIPGHSITLPVSEGYMPSETPGQIITESGGGVLRTTEIAPTTRTLSIPLQNITRAQYVALKNFIALAQWSSIDITVTDPFDTYREMHYTDGLDTGRWSRGDEYSTTLRLRQSQSETLLLSGAENIVPNAQMKSGAGWSRTAENAQWVTLASAPGATGVRVTGNAAVSGVTRFAVSDYLHTVSCDIRRVSGTGTVKMWVKFRDSGGAVIAGSTGTLTGWASRSTLHYWCDFVRKGSTANHTVRRAGGDTSTLLDSNWHTYVGKFGREGGQIPDDAVVFELGFDAVNRWEFTNYNLRTTL